MRRRGRCVGEFDACGICNGPGAIYECGCEDILQETDATATNSTPWELVAGRAKPMTMETACGDVDSCVGEFDACGICNGPGAIYECGCEDIPAGDCDCNGNQLDALGTCGGTCEADDDGDGVCDDVDSCVGEFDACSICNGPGAIYEWCEDILQETATAMATSLTPLAYVAVLAQLTQTAMAFAMT